MIVRQTDTGEQLSVVRIVNDPVALALQIEKAGPNPEVVLEATYGWYWAVGRLGGGRRVGASGTSVGCQGVPIPTGEERRARRAVTWRICCG